MKGSIAAALLSLLTLSACTVGPDYRTPASAPPARFQAETVKAPSIPMEKLERWWTLLDDPVLSKLVEHALERNQDLAISAARVSEARARLGVIRGRWVPSVDGSIDYDGSRRSPNAALGGDKGFEHLFGLGFDTSWEIDLFGQISREVEATGADLAASVEQLRDVRVTLLADIARSYVQYRLTQVRLEIARGNREIQSKTRDFVATRFEAGLVPELDLRQAERILATTRAEIPVMEADLQALRNTISVLCGAYPGAFDAELRPQRPIPVPPMNLALGVPADLLRRRPDIRAAERDLAAATARVGVATADLYPKLNLRGTLRLEATNPDQLASTRSLFYSLGPTFSWNLFSRDITRARIAAEEARVEQSYQRYRKLLRRAVEEVESALVDQRGQSERRKSLSIAVEQARLSFELSQGAYEDQLIDFQNVLDNQRTLLTLQDQLAANRSAITLATLRLYKALGGGWTLPRPRQESQETPAHAE